MAYRERDEMFETPSVSEARALAKLINIKLLIVTFSSHSATQRSIRRVGGDQTSCLVVTFAESVSACRLNAILLSSIR